MMNFGLFCIILGTFENIAKKDSNMSDLLIDQAYFMLYFQNL